MGWNSESRKPNESVGRWLVWDGRRWAHDERGEVQARARDVVRELVNEAMRPTVQAAADYLERGGHPAALALLAERVPA